MHSQVRSKFIQSLSMISCDKSKSNKDYLRFVNLAGFLVNIAEDREIAGSREGFEVIIQGMENHSYFLDLENVSLLCLLNLLVGDGEIQLYFHIRLLGSECTLAEELGKSSDGELEIFPVEVCN